MHNVREGRREGGCVGVGEWVCGVGECEWMSAGVGVGEWVSESVSEWVSVCVCVCVCGGGGGGGGGGGEECEWVWVWVSEWVSECV